MSTFDDEFMVIRTEDYRASPWIEIDRVFDHFGLREPSIAEWRMIHDTCNVRINFALKAFFLFYLVFVFKAGSIRSFEICRKGIAMKESITKARKIKATRVQALQKRAQTELYFKRLKKCFENSMHLSTSIWRFC